MSIQLQIYTENYGTPLHYALHQLCLAIASSGGLQLEPDLIQQLYAIDKTGPAMVGISDVRRPIHRNPVDLDRKIFVD